MDKFERTDLFLRAIGTWGAESQMRQAQKECGELIAAISQFIRGRIDFEKVITEIADVKIMIEQLCLMFGPAVDVEMERKLERLKEILKKEKGK